MILSNDLKTKLLANILASDLNANQMKFLMFLYRVTIDCQCLEAKIPSLNQIANSISKDNRDFRRDVYSLLERDIIKRTGKFYGFNFEFDIWGTNCKSKKNTIEIINATVHEAIKNRKK